MYINKMKITLLTYIVQHRTVGVKLTRVDSLAFMRKHSVSSMFTACEPLHVLCVSA